MGFKRGMGMAVSGKPRMRWIGDEPPREVRTPQDLIGATGAVGGIPFVVERVLEIGQNQVVYCFFSEAKNIRMAYGFDHRLVDSSVKR